VTIESESEGETQHEELESGKESMYTQLHDSEKDKPELDDEQIVTKSDDVV